MCDNSGTLNLFGLEIRRSSPRLRVEGTNFQARSIANTVKAVAPSLPQTQILPPSGMAYTGSPQSFNDAGSLTDRQITNDPREQWYLALPTKLTPNQAELIKRAAAGGDTWQQHQLLMLMLDSWPMFNKCDHELREAVSNVRFVVHPYAEEGQEPSVKAKAKADCVRRAMKNMKPETGSDEREFKGMLYHLAGAFVAGLVVEELIYKEPSRMPGGMYEQSVKAAAFTHPRHFAFTSDGKIALYRETQNDWLTLNKPKAAFVPNPNKFIVGQFYSTSGTSLTAGRMRPLAWYFAALVYNREWILNAAKNFGSPFLKAMFEQSTNLPQLDKFLKEAGPNRFIRYPAGVTVEVEAAQSLGTENPQRYLAEEADQQCQLLILGQTLTSNTPKSGGGTRAQGQVHLEVRQDRVEGVAKWLAVEPLAQFAAALCRVNFGDDDECPVVEPDFTKPLDALEKAEYITAISTSTVPLPAEDVYKTLGFAMPETGDQVLVGGKLGTLGDTETEIDANPIPPPPPGLDENGDAIPPTGGEDAPPVKAKRVKISFKTVRARLAAASEQDLSELEQLVVAAETAPHQNGELKALQQKLLTVGRRNKV